MALSHAAVAMKPGRRTRSREGAWSTRGRDPAVDDRDLDGLAGPVVSDRDGVGHVAESSWTSIRLRDSRRPYGEAAGVRAQRRLTLAEPEEVTAIVADSWPVGRVWPAGGWRPTVSV